MGWFSKPSPPPEPVYSELGQEVYRLLEEKEGEWVCHDYVHIRESDRGLEHPPTRLFIHIWESGKTQGVVVRESRHANGIPTLSRLMTNDDLRRIGDRVRKVMAERVRQRQYEEMKRALERLKPNRFDATCRDLARAVLNGDASAAQPLIDKCIECLQEG
jgi:hypothetical protein